MTFRLLALACTLALALTACGDDAATGAADEPEATTPPATDPEPADDEDEATEAGVEPDDDEVEETAPEAAAAVVGLESTDLGDVLVDGEGMTLYLFDADVDGESTCYGDCAGTWPPLLGEAEAADGVDANLLGVTERTTGELQVTYAGHPLYYFAGDSRPGETGGQGIGDVWWVLDASGAAVHGAEASDGRGSPYDY